jgi:predicted ester cyclase
MLEEFKAHSARVFEEIYVGQNLALIEELFHPQYVQKPLGFSGHEGVRRYVQELHTAFSDLAFHLEGQIAEDDSVVNFVAMVGKHTGLLQGHIPATDREFMVIAAIIHRYYQGQIVEGIILSDQLGLMQQLGVVPTPVWAKVKGDQS